MRTVFMGTPDFAVPCLKRLHQLAEVIAVYTQPDRRQGRGLKTTPPPVKVAAEGLDIAVYQPERLGRPNAWEQLKQLQPDLIVVGAYAQLLPRKVLQLPPQGCINVHASLLPAYRGGAPIHWAILNGEAESGVTTMLMSEQLDAGDILLQARTPIGADETTGELHDRLAILGADLLAETLHSLQQGQLQPRPQPQQGVSYARNILKSDGLIDWSRPAAQIHNQVRGLNPWPAAFTWHGERMLRVWASRVLPEQEQGQPGEVLRLAAEGPVIATGDGALVLITVQPANKRRMSGADYARGYQLEVGALLTMN
jgi:methionyl-tRNA formyltransferase